MNTQCLPDRLTTPEPMRLRGTALVIDDDAWIRSLIADFLTAEGFRVAQAVDSFTGLRMAEQIRPNVILLDLALPMHSGLQVLHRLKERQPTREIPIIIVSAYAMLLLRPEASHTDGLLLEPLDLKQLLNQVNRVIKEAHPKFRLLPPAS